MSKPLTHADRLAPFTLTVRGCVDNIAQTFARATPADIESGARWYADGEGIIGTLAAQTGRSRECVATVIAHLSPRTTWARNVQGATSLLLTDSAPGCIGANIDRARAAIASPDPLSTLNGPKTLRFARNLLGDRESVTVDVWAARVAFNGRDDSEAILSRAGVYAAVEHCYRLAARRLALDPVTVQATTWIVARGGRAH